MLFLTLFACFVKYAPVTPTAPAVKWEAKSDFSDLGIAKEDCSSTLRNQELQRLGLCKEVSAGKTLCKGTVTNFRVTYGMVDGKIHCRVLR
jgi:hypothetical protein